MNMPLDIPLILFWLKKAVSIMVLPPLGPLLLIVLGLWLARRSGGKGLGLAWLGVALTVFFSTPASTDLILDRLEPQAPLATAALAKAQAIVILGGGQNRHAPEYGGATVNRLSLERLRYGARLARSSGLPILVSGGAATGEASEASLMKAALEEDFRVPVKWTESASRDTRENARLSGALLLGRGIRRIVLVTHAAHMPRAQAEFQTAGFEVTPAPTAWFGGPGGQEEALDFVPSPASAYAGWLAAHEWLGNLAYRLSR